MVHSTDRGVLHDVKISTATRSNTQEEPVDLKHQRSGLRCDLTRYWQLILVALLEVGCACQDDEPTARVLDWGVLDKTTNVNVDVASGGTFKIDGSHHYIVTLRAKDPDGIRHLAVWGDGMFTCATDPGLHGGTFAVAPNLLPAAVPRTDTAIPSAGSFQGFVMSVPFVYSELSCGTHTFGGPLSGPQNYRVSDGTLHIHGEETSWPGTVSSATLDLTP